MSTADVGGGAEAVALGLHRAYRARGVDAWLAVGFQRGEDDRVLAVGGGRSRRFRALRDPAVLLDLARGREDFRFPASHRLLELPPQSPDVVHVHNLHGGYFDLRALPALASARPTVATMHDEWLYTGHCATTLGCERWRDACGDCPRLDVYPALRVDGTAENRRRKAGLYRGLRVHAVAPSSWLLDRARESILTSALASARVIPNGVDLSVFTPGDRAEARSSLDLPHDRHLVVSAAQGARGNQSRDFPTLHAALERLGAEPGPEVVVVVLGEEGPVEQLGRVRLVSRGFAKPEAVASHLRAADVCVHASRADNHPLVVLESLACGTPVVASRVGGIPEQLTEETGMLVEPSDPEALAAALGALLADPALRERMGAAGAVDARARFSLDGQVDAYLALYEEVVREC